MARISTFASIIAVGLTHDMTPALVCLRFVQYGDTTLKYSLPSLCIKWTTMRLTSELREHTPRCLRHSYWRMSQRANEIAHSRFCTQRRACLKDACVPCEAAMAQQAGCATKMAAQHTCPLGAALFVLARSQQGKRPRPRRKYAGTGKPQAAFQPSDMCQTPESAGGMTYRISHGGRG